MSITVCTNNQWRAVLTWDELTAKERADFDYLTDDQARMDANFMRYKGTAYDLGEAVHNAGDTTEFAGWDAFYTSTVWSGVLVKVRDDMSQVKVARFYQ